jgi:hypothetical protein
LLYIYHPKERFKKETGMDKTKQRIYQLFANPTSEYRGAPFWAWNCALKKETLEEQIEYFKEMGFGGFHMHVRTGLKTPYLSEEFMDCIRFCVDTAKKKGMFSYLYDEDRWPSGAAGGLVTKHREFRTKYLLLTRIDCRREKEIGPINYAKIYEGGKNAMSMPQIVLRTPAVRQNNGEYIGCYDVVLNEDGTMRSYEKINSKAQAEGTKWYAFMETVPDNPWFNGQAYIDGLNPRAIEKFIETTHEVYKKKTGDEFGKTIPSIFTDEPQLVFKSGLKFPEGQDDIFMPWTADFAKTYKEQYGEDIVARLPEIFWNLPEGKPSVVRYHYHDHISERFASAFADVLGSWCRENGIALTGHMMEETTLKGQTMAISEAMRSYRSFEIPGIDILFNSYEFTTAKQAQSVVHQSGASGMMSELYGVTDWDFDFRGHKLQGDWQAALGVTLRVPHLSWMSMEGSAKRDYPASINYQVPWYKKYSLLEDHFGRVNVVMAQGKPSVKIGVIHPIESYWLLWGPEAQTALARDEMDKKFQDLTDWLILQQNDFDFIAESLLAEQADSSRPGAVGKMEYEVILIPSCTTMRETTLSFLKSYQRAGGKIIVLGEYPEYLNAVKNERVNELKEISERIPFDKLSLYQAVYPYKNVSILNSDGTVCEDRIYQMREDGSDRWLFIANGVYPSKQEIDLPVKKDVKIQVFGNEYDAEVFDTMTGERYWYPTSTKNGMTQIEYSFYVHDSLLLHLTPKTERIIATERGRNCIKELKVNETVPVTLSEPNVLMLDGAEYALDNEEYREREEILRLDNELRSRLGWPSRMDSAVQPYILGEETIEHKVRLRFKIESERKIEGACLAVEDAEKIKITWNGTTVPSEVIGWYVDKSIKKVVIPEIKEGENVLEMEIPFGRTTDLEWCYLLGDFGVRVKGRKCILEEPVRELHFSDIVSQGLPFYGGNITYHLEAETSKNTLSVHIPQYRGALVSVSLNGKEKGNLTFAPYNAELSGCIQGKNKIDITLYGNRVNTFGCVHNSNPGFFYHGPDCFRTIKDEWTYGYVLKETGILNVPVISEISEEK